MNKYELAKKITQLDGLTNEEKASLVELLRSQKKYGLVWEDKPEEIETRLVDELPVLTEVPERAIVSDSPDSPNHILIEGDNLEALTALAYTHEGKIDVIYIDPPYNTGNKDFVYNDSFVDREDGYRHSKWLSFMNKRLQIAKSLLSSEGVIFISIDENEIAQLRILGDEIFSEKNFVGQWNWFKSATPPALSKKIKRTVEYILCWKSPTNDITFQGAKKISKSNDPFTKPQNTYKVLAFPPYSISCTKQSGLIKSGTYGTTKFPNELLNDLVIENGKNANEVRFRNRFIWIQETLNKNIQEGIKIELSAKGVLSYKRSNYSPEVPPNFIDVNVGVDTTENAGRMLLDIFGGQVFDYPKPVSLIKYLINFTPDKKLTILDFFAGSGTTLHATMQLNAEDGGHRKCILVTNNENNICEEVTYERNKRVIQGYTTPKGEEVEGLHANSLRYYRTKFLSRDKSVKNMRQLVRLATDMLCIKNDVYTEAEFCGKHLNPNIARYFDNGQGNRMLVIYEERAIQLLVQLMAQTEDDGIKTMVYVFSPGADPYTDDFEDVAERVKLCALPSAIYEAYKRVLPKRKPKFLDEALQEMKAQAESEANMQQTLDFGEDDNMNEEGGEA